MYFWNSKALADQLKNNELSEDEKAHYLLVRIALVGIWFNLPNATFSLRDEFLVTLNQVLIIIIAVVGIYAVSRINKQGDNKDFVLRYVCLSVPSSIQICLYTSHFIISYLSFPLFRR